MSKRLEHLRRCGIGAASALLLGTVGCAFPNGSTGGDPLFGNFNRPFVATPPPERGGLGLDSPAYDAGARIGVTAPDVPASAENSSGFMSLPNLTAPNLISGARMPFSAPDDSGLMRRASGPAGARLPMTETGARLPAFGMSGARPMPAYTSGATLVQMEQPQTPVKKISYEVLRDPSQVRTMEEGQAMLQSAGAKSQRSEQVSEDEWSFACSVGSKSYECRGKDAMEAMRLVIEQVHKDR
jgi:hypothetical protein